jgi:hypothetical protein
MGCEPVTFRLIAKRPNQLRYQESTELERRPWLTDVIRPHTRTTDFLLATVCKYRVVYSFCWAMECKVLTGYFNDCYIISYYPTIMVFLLFVKYMV